MHYSFKSTPTWTMKSRTETITKSNQYSSIPGPAHYNAKKSLPNAGTISTTKQQRNLYKTIEPNPGPGNYQAKSYITQGTKRSMSARYLDSNKHTPGPMDYENNTLKVKGKAPTFSMGNRSKSARQILLDHNSYKPSPVSYTQHLATTHAAFIGTSKRKDLTETQKTPASNYYSIGRHNSHHPTCSIGSEFRKTDFKKGQITPGPAFYEKKSFVQFNKDHKKGYSVRQKTTDLVALELSKYPGPGGYESHLKNKSLAPRCATSQDKRKTFMDDMQNLQKQYPGPGVHDPQFRGTKYRSASAYNFGKSVRKPLDQNQKTPGPQEYNNSKINFLNTAPHFSPGKNTNKNQFLMLNPENPGPGQYDPNLNLVKYKSTTSEIPKQKRPDFEKQRFTPGPGYYNLRGKESGPTWIVPKQKRIAFTDLKCEAKHGQHYEIPSMIANPPKYMNVQSKIQFSSSKTMARTGFNDN